ncbi:MAG: hypothetical protein QXT63_03030 [Thermoplasmata archaeon]
MKRAISKIGSLALASIFFLSAFVAIVGSADGQGQGTNNWLVNKVEKEQGVTDKLGGGSYVAVKFGNDSWFAVIYGTQEHPNSIIICSIAQRYLGAAKVVNENGKVIFEQAPIRVQTVYALRLATIYEFNDSNGNGICDFERSSSNDVDYIEHEHIFKRAPLWGAWTLSPVNDTISSDNKTRTLEFSLSRTDIEYKRLIFTVPGIKLEKVQFNFKLKAELVEVNGVSYPTYTVTVAADPMQKYKVTKSEEGPTKTFNGTVAKYTVKADHIIEGWDFAENNTNPYLLLETQAIVANHVGEGVSRWGQVQFMKNETNGTASMQTDNGTMALGDDSSADEGNSTGLPKRMYNHPRIELKDKWNRMGHFTWVTKVNVTNNGVTEEKNMYYQVQGAFKFLYGSPGTTSFLKGFVIIGGFSYPGGEKIYHDPEMGAENTLPYITEKLPTSPKKGRLPGFEALGLLAALGVASIILLSRKRI